VTTLVTGGCGFVGLNVVEQLLAEGEHVVAFDRIGLRGSSRDLARDHGGQLEVIIGDVRDAREVNAMFDTRRIDAVVHAAAITAGEQREASDPHAIVAVNVNGTLNVLSAAHAAACKRFVYAGSGQAYGDTHDQGAVLREEDSPSRPRELYGITKLAGEQIVLRLARLWQMSAACVRLGSVCGPWELDTGMRDMLSPHLQVARLAVRGETAIVPPREPWRDWIYSRDVAAGLVALLRSPSLRHSVYHLSAGSTWNGAFVRWCEALRSAYPAFQWRIAGAGERANVSFIIDRDRAPMDNTRMRSDIGFTPRFDARSAYVDYIQWISCHEDFMSGINDPSHPASARAEARA